MGHLRGVLLLLAACGLACAPPPPGGIYYARGDRSVTSEGLHRVQWEPFATSFVKPGADLQHYDRVLIAEPTVSYRSPPRAAPTALTKRRPVAANYALSEHELAVLKRSFRSQLAKAFAGSPLFTVSDSPGPDVLQIAGHIVDLEVTLPPPRYREAGGGSFAASPGRMTLVLDVADSQSGEVLVRVGQRRHIEMAGGGLYPVNLETYEESLRQIFGQWAGELRRELERFHALAVLPPTPAAP